ncbi:hypothetical protein PCASD_09569 [Puccinia coronata f. sp. avenae]|uniref:Uncharacterized protein n=1 Tax=Puccinia coronata f. sp. avenae TaxID=200324 RepID=A0A2N5V2B0_9BASI|nr:hypothetical protein PCASD_09569 [Puccinia coronata f. sp. avenae]
MPTGPISLPQRKGRKTAVYFAGSIFAAGWWVFFDACTLSATMKPSPESPFDPVPVHVTFTDWIPGLCSTIGMIIVNLIDKKRLISDGSAGISFSAHVGVAWKARLLLFMGFALMAGGLAGSITVLILKYAIPDWGTYDVTYWGVANVLQNLAVMVWPGDRAGAKQGRFGGGLLDGKSFLVWGLGNMSLAAIHDDDTIMRSISDELGRVAHSDSNQGTT